MAGIRQSGSNEIFVRGDVDKVFDACLKAANEIGSVKQNSKAFGSISVKTPMKMFPPTNPVNLKIAVIPQDGGCMIRCNGDSVDGAVGLGSVGKIIDKFYNALERYF